MTELIPILFWISLLILFYTFIGYPLLISVFSRLFRRPIAFQKCEFPTVTIVLAAHNEEERISARLRNLLSSDYPAGKLNILVVSDGSTDQTAKKIEEFNDPAIQLMTQARRSGKAQCLNLACDLADGEIIVFADTRQNFAPNTIRELAKYFSDPKVGAVSGALMIETAATSVGGGVDAYWRLEKIIRSAESKCDSSIGCTGAVYAIRRKLFQPIPPDTLLDDVVIPMQVALQNYRVAFEPDAVAFDPQSLEPERERIRKQRTLAGNFQMLFRYANWLLPWRNRLWWQLISHKYFRLGGPLFLLTLFITNAVLIEKPFYRWFFLGQCFFYFLALCGVFFRSKKLLCFSVPAGFVFLNLMTIRGFFYFIGGGYQSGWRTTKIDHALNAR